MAKAIRGYLVSVSAWSGLLVSALVAAGCSGATAPTGLIEDPAIRGEAAVALPDPAGISHEASMLETPSWIVGSAFRFDVLNQHVTADSDVAVFTPLDAAGKQPLAISSFSLEQAAIALYSFDVSEIAGGGALELNVLCQAPPDGSTLKAYAAFANRQRNAWDFAELSWDPDNALGPRFVGHSQGGLAGPWLDVALIVFGDTELRAASLGLTPLGGALPGGGLLSFRKGWDGTVKGTSKFDSSIDVEADATGRLHATYYDSSVGQLYHMWLEDSVWKTQAVDCDGDVGLYNDLVPTPDGGLLLAYYDAGNKVGALKWMAPENMDAMIWSPRSNFEDGVDETGTSIEAGRNPSVVFDDDDVPHVFYECATTGRIREAIFRPSEGTWLHDYVSPEGTTEGQPIGLNTPYGVYCLTRKGWDGCIYGPDRGGTGWTGKLFASDLHNPLDPSSELAYFDAVCRDATLVIAMACTGGQRIVHFDLESEEITENQIYNDRPGGGGFLDLELMGDGSVRIAQYNASDRVIYFETGDIPTEEQFTSLPVVQLGGPDEDCDGISFWVDPDDDADGLHDAVLATLTTKAKPLSESSKKEFKGHVTLLK